MRHVLAAAAVGAGIALIAFVFDWLLDHLDEVDEPEPLWPASKPYSRTYSFDEAHRAGRRSAIRSATDEEKARIKAWVTEERAKAAR